MGTELGRKVGPLDPSWALGLPHVHANAQEVHSVECSAVTCFLPFVTGSTSSVNISKDTVLRTERDVKRVQRAVFSGAGTLICPSLQVPWSQTHRPGLVYLIQQRVTGKQPIVCCPGLGLVRTSGSSSGRPLACGPDVLGVALPRDPVWNGLYKGMALG